MATIPALLTAAFLTFAPAVAGAKQIIVKPQSLIPYSNTQTGFTNALYTSTADPGISIFYYPLALGPGARLTGLEYYHSGTAGASSAVGIVRSKASDATPMRGIYAAASTTDTGSILAPIRITGALVAGADTTRRAGWTYFLLVVVNDPAGVWNIRVTYE